MSDKKAKCPAGYHDGANDRYQYGCKDPLCEELRQRYLMDTLNYERELRRQEAARIEKKHLDDVAALKNELARANRLLDLALKAMDEKKSS